MSDWNSPELDDTYVSWPAALKARADALATMFGNGSSWTNLPTDTRRWNDSLSRFEKWNGSIWVNLSSALTDVLKTANNLSDLTNVPAARASLGLGSLAVINSPLPVANGGTGGTDQATARSGLGLGSLAIQNAATVAITGGSLTGITALSMAAGSTLNMTSGSLISGVSYYVNNGAVIEYNTTGGEYAHYWKTNNTYRAELYSAGFSPTSDLNLNLGQAGKRWNIAYINTLATGIIDNGGDIAVRYSGTTYWLFGSGAAKDFRPNSNGLQSLGFTSYWWGNCYLDTIIGRQTFIQMSAGGGDAQIRYAAGTSGEHYFYNNNGGTLLWVIENTGKLNPYSVGRQVWTHGTYTPRRVTNGTSMTVNECGDAITTLANDLKALGLLG